MTHTSSFKTTGKITPEEFVRAGDHLVYKFPTWNWGSAVKASDERDFLPKDKQYLVTEQVPSYIRAIDFETLGEEAYKAEQEEEEEQLDQQEADEEDAEWVGSKRAGLTDAYATTTATTTTAELKTSNIPDINSNLIDLGAESDDNDDNDVYTASNTRVPTRTYNIYITYSTSYRVPKVYLSGFNQNGSPLLPNEMMEDVMTDYRDKTVTIEKAPWDSGLTVISIHPCRHANVMRVLLDRAEARARAKHEEQHQQQDDDDVAPQIAKLGLNDGATDEPSEDWEEIDKSEPDVAHSAIPVDQYLVIFLKFIASVTPGIEHDYTMSAF